MINVSMHVMSPLQVHVSVILDVCITCLFCVFLFDFNFVVMSVFDVVLRV